MVVSKQRFLLSKQKIKKNILLDLKTVSQNDHCLVQLTLEMPPQKLQESNKGHEQVFWSSKSYIWHVLTLNKIKKKYNFCQDVFMFKKKTNFKVNFHSTIFPLEMPPQKLQESNKGHEQVFWSSKSYIWHVLTLNKIKKYNFCQDVFMFKKKTNFKVNFHSTIFPNLFILFISFSNKKKLQQEQ